MVEHNDSRSEKDDAAFLERVAGSLRAVERAHPSFERRLMEKVRAEGPTLYPATLTHASWWRTALSLIHISEPTRLALISYAVFCLKKIFFFFFNDTATTEIYTLHIVGSVRCV